MQQRTWIILFSSCFALSCSIHYQYTGYEKNLGNVVVEFIGDSIIQINSATVPEETYQFGDGHWSYFIRKNELEFINLMNKESLQPILDSIPKSQMETLDSRAKIRFTDAKRIPICNSNWIVSSGNFQDTISENLIYEDSWCSYNVDSVILSEWRTTGSLKIENTYLNLNWAIPFDSTLKSQIDIVFNGDRSVFERGRRPIMSSTLEVHQKDSILQVKMQHPDSGQIMLRLGREEVSRKDYRKGFRHIQDIVGK